MKQEAKILAGIGLLTIAILAGSVVLLSKSSAPSLPSQKADEKLLVRESSNKLGSPSAKVTLVEFGDYQCPACGQAHPVIKAITDNYKGKILLVFRDFPLSMHSNAEVAAEAAEAAGAQGKYWQMHDLLYENQDKWAKSSRPLDIFASFAKDIGLDGDKFKKDVEESKFSNKISEDLSDGNALGVNATPTLFLNGKQMVGVPNYNDLKKNIDELLK